MNLQIDSYAWGALLAVLATASTAGMGLSRSMPWTRPARAVGMPIAFGVALGPLVLGLAASAALALLPGRSAFTHALFIGSVLVCLSALLARRRLQDAADARIERETASAASRHFLRLLLWLWAASLLAAALYRPLLQNDALEYLIVGRALYRLRDLAAYPLLDSGMDPSGFIGPWTHPPLYVALIYVANLVQGHADSPGLARLIAPWATLCTAYLAYALGRIWSRLAGTLAALFLLSAPLYFLGATSALIDPLPILGMSLVLAAVVGVEMGHRGSAVTRGATIGAAMWTHSQAILLAPLGLAAVVASEARPLSRACLRVAGLTLASLIVVAIWPYVRNLRRFGTLISDTPVVFAVPSLGWDDYFRMQRGYDSWADRIQYGVLKGWFAPEAYSFVFWFALLGIALIAGHIRASGGWRGFLEPARSASDRLSRVVLVVFGCYLVGVVLSLLVGVDLMIRNERYLLLMLPAASLLAAYGLHELWGWSRQGPGHQRRATRYARRALSAAAVCAFVLSLMAVGVYAGARDAVRGFSGQLDVREQLGRSAAYMAVDFLRRETPSDALVLSLKPADMYYANRTMISYLDPRLLDFYAAEDEKAAYDELRRLNVRYLHIPDYSLPPFYNSRLQEIAARPEWSKLLFSSGGYQIYELTRTHAPNVRTPYADGHVTWISGWTGVRQINLGGRKNLLRFVVSRTEWQSESVESKAAILPLFQREQSILLISGSGDPAGAGNANTRLPVAPGASYRVELQAHGRGFAQVMLYEYDHEFRLIDHYMLGETALGEQKPQRTFRRRFVAGHGTAFVRIGIEHRGSSSITIAKAGMSKL